MYSTSASLVGKPVYPRLSLKPASLRERIAGDSATQALYKKLIAAGNDFQQRQAAVQELLAGESSPTRVIDVSVLASQAFSVRRLEEALAILNDPRIAELSAEIEKRARILFKSLLVGDRGAARVTDLAHGHAMSREVLNILAIDIPDIVQCLKIAELNDRKLIIYLRDDHNFRKEFVAVRKDYQPPAEIEKLQEEFMDDLAQLRTVLTPLREMTLFWSPDGYLRKKITDRNTQEYLWSQVMPTIEVEKYLTHDIGHTFASGMIDGLALATERKKYHLGMFLHGFCHLSLHLEHHKYILAVNKYRLDGELPKVEDIPFARVVETAAYAASFRWRLPLNVSEEPKAGYVNCFVEEGIGKATYPAFLDIIIYNLIINSIKAEIEAGKKEGDIKITVAMKRDEENPNVVVISVEDCAQGFSPEKLLAAARNLLEEPGNKGIKENFPVLKKIIRWREAPFSLRTFSVGELLDLAFVAKITGFSDQSISSGLGLFEIAEFTQLLGADVLITNKYQGGARIDLILGSETERERIIARELGYEES